MKKIWFLFLTLCSAAGMVNGDISWSAPTAISTALTDASDPRVVIDANNNITAAWIENDVIQSSSFPSGGSWSAPVTLSNVLNISSNPLLGIDSSGNVTALWIEDGFITSATLPFGGSWSAATTVSDSGAETPSLAVDSSDNAVAVWIRSGFVESSTRLSGTWSLVSVLSEADSSFAHVAISDFGTALAAWHTLTISGADAIVTDILTISSNTWDPPKNVIPITAAHLHNYPKIAIDNNGNAAIAWFRYDLLDGNAYQNVQVLISNLTEGATAWALPTILTNSGLRNPDDLILKLRFDTSGNALAVWTNSYDGQTFTIESSQQLLGGSWPLPVTPQNPSLYSFGFDVSITSGTALMTNMAWNGVSSIEIISAETDTTNPVFQAWSMSQVFSTGNDNAFPKCAISLSGGTFNAVAVWMHFDGVNNVIHAATGSGTAIDPPSSVSASQSLTDFGVYQDYTNTITWVASSDPNVIQYNIFRNGVFFAATDPSTLTFTDHNTIQNGTVTYGVAALLSSFRQSDIASFTLFP